MSEKVIYSRTSVSRKPKYRLTTSIIESSGKKWVRKTAAHPEAQPYLIELLGKEKLLKNQLKDLTLVTSRLDNQGLIAPYIDGELLDQDFRWSLISGSWDECLNILLRVMKLIDSQRQTTRDFSKLPEFTAVFGNAWRDRYKALRVGYLDYNLDNLIRTKSGLYLIDYEFTYDFPLPIDMVKCRFLLSYLERYSDLIRLLSRDRKLTALSKSLSIPSSWLKEPEVSRLLKQHLALTVKSEASFQKYYSFGYSPINLLRNRVSSASVPHNEFLIDRFRQNVTLVNKQAQELQKLRSRNNYLENYTERINHLLPIQTIRKTKALVRKWGYDELQK